jgi:cyclase
MSHEEKLFDLRKVGDGVYLAVATPAYKVNSNTAIIETDDGLVVVDTHSKPSAARAVIALLKDVTSKPVRYVVNTHFHWDHWQGNEVHVRAMPAEIATLRAQLAAATDAARRAELGSSLRQAEAYFDEVRALRPALPTLAFENTMRIFKRDREIHLLYLGRAHTEGDVFVHLPKEKLVVTGDTVIGWTPFMGDGYPQDWGRTLARLEQLEFTQLLMGHGEPAGRDWLRVFRGYVEDLVAAVGQEAAAGASLDEVRQRVPDRLAPKYEAAFSKYGSYRPWRTLVLTNIERAYAMVS